MHQHARLREHNALVAARDGIAREEVPSLLLLKMDIEGAEIDVLLTSVKLAAVSRIFVEYHSFVGREQRLDELLSYLRQLGFRTWIQTQYCPALPFHETHPHADMDLQLNIFAKREG
jgi:hypothetical protein